MSLESVTHISDLVAANPTASDTVAQGDDHIRNIKTALKTDFPNISGVMSLSHTQLNLLDTKSLTANGYQKFPSGMVMQWGTTTSSGAGSGNAAVTYPIAFATATLNVQASVSGTGSGSDVTIQIGASTTTGVSMTAVNNGTNTTGIGLYWLAIGH